MNFDVLAVHVAKGHCERRWRGRRAAQREAPKDAAAGNVGSVAQSVARRGAPAVRTQERTMRM